MISIDYKDSSPLYEQIADKIKHLIWQGVLNSDDKLPSVRNLAIELSLNPNTVQKAYGYLEREGYVYTVQGKGNFVVYNKELTRIQREEAIDNVRKAIDYAIHFGMTRDEVIEAVRSGGTIDD